MEGQFEDAESDQGPLPQVVLDSKKALESSSQSEEDEMGSNWSDEYEDYYWEDETRDFTKKLAAVKSGNQPNPNRKQPVADNPPSTHASSKTFHVSSTEAPVGTRLTISASKTQCTVKG